MQQQKHTHPIEQLLYHLKSTDHDEAMNQEEPLETIHVYSVRESEEPAENVIDATPQQTKKPSPLFTAVTILFSLCLPLAAILFQLSLLFDPPIATVTIIPTVQTFTLKSTLQLGRVLNPITLSQTGTAPTTGKGHQIARAAAGFITFYNGQFQSVPLAAGTILTGSDGVRIVTDQTAVVPAGNPPTYGQITVSAHAVTAGVRGNIAAYDINQPCCAAAVRAENVSNFTSGQDERNFQTVTKQDIATATTPLKATIAASSRGALQGQLKAGEELVSLPCTPTVTSDHQPGDEATTVTLTVSETCSAVAYNSQALRANATELLTSQAGKKLGAQYRVLGDIQVTSTQATVNQQTPKAVLSFTADGTFVYALNSGEQEWMKHLIAGKTTQEALQRVATLPSIASVAIAWDAQTKLPKDTNLIHLVFIYSS